MDYLFNIIIIIHFKTVKDVFSRLAGHNQHGDWLITVRLDQLYRLKEKVST